MSSQKKLFFFIALVLAIPGFSQLYRGHYMPFGLGYAFQTVKDNSISPVSYSGNLGLINGGYYYQDERWLSAFDLSGFGGFLNPDINAAENDTRITLIGARAVYSLSYRVYEVRDWLFFAGLLSHNAWDYRSINRYVNSSFNFDGLFSFGVQLTAQKPFEIAHQRFGLQYALGVPFGTYYLRPGYIKPLFNEKIGSRGFEFWGDYYLLDSRTDILWQVNEINYIRLSYQWEFAQLNAPNKLQMANHFLSLSTIFKF